MPDILLLTTTGTENEQTTWYDSRNVKRTPRLVVPRATAMLVMAVAEKIGTEMDAMRAVRSARIGVEAEAVPLQLDKEGQLHAGPIFYPVPIDGVAQRVALLGRWRLHLDDDLGLPGRWRAPLPEPIVVQLGQRVCHG